MTMEVSQALNVRNCQKRFLLELKLIQVLKAFLRLENVFFLGVSEANISDGLSLIQTLNPRIKF